MTENKRLFIKSDDYVSDRWLHQSELFRKEKNFNINLPKEREFKTGECIITDKDDTAYSIDELVNLLNYFNRCTVSSKEALDLKLENKKLKEKLFEAKRDYLLETADKPSLDAKLEQLRKDIFGDVI